MDAAYFAESIGALSAISFKYTVFAPLQTALEVIATFGLQSIILLASDSAERLGNTTYSNVCKVNVTQFLMSCRSISIKITLGF